jgi:uncharacterized protein YgbK (DUF1537 family)
MSEEAVGRAELFGSLAAEWPEELLPEIRRAAEEAGRTVVVLDDDPTGTQTVHGVRVLCGWGVDALAAELRDEPLCFYVLTNSRSVPLAEAAAMNAEIGRNLREASRRAGRDFVVVSRSDSTLRGHFPGEVRALAEALGGAFDGWIVMPFFEEGGRYTVGDVHYVAEGDELLPAALTPFARDASFGYAASDLREWVEEKTGGEVGADQVLSVSIDDLRRSGPHGVAEKLGALEGGAVCVVNAAGYRDAEVFVRGLLEAEARGKRFLYRTAASFVRVRAGIASRPLLRRDEMGLPQRGGALFVVGSHVPRSTDQLACLLDRTDAEGIELSVEALLGDDAGAEVARVAGAADACLADGRDAAVYTSRTLVTGADAEESLSIGARVSEAVVGVVRTLRNRPRYLVGKGGITSSDLATEALGVRRATVLGQILPGVPVWRAGRESRWPRLAYVVFPGNVGGTDALVRIVEELA